NVTLLSILIAVVFAPGLSVTSNLITGIEGGSVSVSCQYDPCYTKHVKYWCRGRERASCKTLVQTDTPQTGGEKVSIIDDHGNLPRFFTVTVRRLEKKDAGWYWCAIQKAAADERMPLYLTVTDDASSLSTESAFTGLVGGSVNVPCHYDVKYRDHVKYWCKGYQWTYCDILKQTDSTHHDSDKISISDDRTGGVFIVTMRRLDKEDTAWYWCAIKLGGTKEADQHFYLYLTVTEVLFSNNVTLLSVLIAVVFAGIPSLSVTSNLITGSKGGSASVSCQYAQLYTEHVKYWCRGREWASCEILVRTDTPQTGGEKVSISDDKGKLPRFFTVTVRGLEKNDTGWYWCAIQKAAADERILLYLTVTDGKETLIILVKYLNVHTYPISSEVYSRMLCSYITAAFMQKICNKLL
ncbi:CMRF35-like molecule 3, partial [Acipenser oxyrinchus oxyrinchus]